MFTSKNIPAGIGFFLWLLLTFNWLPVSTFSLTYVHILVLAAPLWLIPLAWQLLDVEDWTKFLGVPASISLGIAFLFEPSLISGILTIPWLFLTAVLAWTKLMDWRIDKSRIIHHLCQLSAYLFLPIGAAWAFADRLGFQPMGFDSTIVLLTVAHFHYAGFLLPTITALALPNVPDQWGRLIGWSVILGIPLVAIGITTTHYNLPIWIEVLSVTVMTFGGFMTGLLYLLLGWKNKAKGFGILWLLAGLALMIGMVLAFCYGWRSVFIIPILSIPWMYAVHGTLNAVGFALPAVLGWSFYQEEYRSD